MSETNGDNKILSEDQERALAYHHKAIYERSLKAKQDAAAAFRDATKVAKADGVSVDRIKILIQLDTPEGEEKLRGEIQERIATAKWANSEIGDQFTFDLTAEVDDGRQAFERGKVAGMQGDTLDLNENQDFAEGWTQGQRILAETLEITSARRAESENKKKAKKARDEEEDEESRDFREQLSDNIAKDDEAALAAA